MTVLTQNPDPKSMNPNHDLNQDTHSTADMVCSVHFLFKRNKLYNPLRTPREQTVQSKIISNLLFSLSQIFSESGTNYRQLTNAKIISGTLIIVTFLMGFFLLSAIYIQTSSRCVCAYGPALPYQQPQESQNTPYFEPLKALSPEGTSKEMRNFPLKIHMNDPKVISNNVH